MKLDLKDRKILYELDRNARISYSKISKKIKLSKNSVIKRIRRLEKEQIILNYATLININQLGYTTYDIYLKFKNTSPAKEKEIIDMLIKNDEVWGVGRAEGEINLALLISTKTPEELFEVWDKIYSQINKNIEIKRIAILLEYHHFNKKYLIENREEKSSVIIGKKGNKKIDEIDIKILKELSRNARISLLELHKKTKLNPKVIQYRIKRLEKEEIILGYKANLNFHKLGYEYYKIMIKLKDLSFRNKIYSWIKENPNVVYYDKFIGGNDFEFDIEIESFEAFIKFLDLLKSNFPNQIESYDYFMGLKIYKSRYF